MKKSYFLICFILLINTYLLSAQCATIGAPSSDQNVVCNGNPTPLSYASIGNVDGSTAYQWESSTTSASSGYTNISNQGQFSTYDPPGGFTQTTYYRLKVTNSCGTPVIGATITVNLAELVINGPSANQTFGCSGDPTPLSYSNIQNDTYTLQWQSNTNGVGFGWEDISGATGGSYDPPITTQTTYYRIATRKGLHGTCGWYFSAPIMVEINPVTISSPVGTQFLNPSNNDPTSLSYTVQNATSYQWEVSTTSSTAGYSDIAGATNISYDPSAINQTSYYRLKATDACSNEVIGTPIKLTYLSNNQLHYAFDNNLTDVGLSPSLNATFHDHFTPANTTPTYVPTPSGGQGISLAHGQHIKLNDNYAQLLLSANNAFDVEIDFRYNFAGDTGGEIPIFAMKNRVTWQPGVTLRAISRNVDTFNIRLELVSENGSGGHVYSFEQLNVHPLPKNVPLKMIFRLDMTNGSWNFSIVGDGVDTKNGNTSFGNFDTNAFKSKITDTAVGARIGWEGANYDQHVCCNSSLNGTMIVDGFKMYAPARAVQNPTLPAVQQPLNYTFEDNLLDTANPEHRRALFSDHFTPTNGMNFVSTPSGGKGINLTAGQHVRLNTNYKELINNNNSFEAEIDFRYTYSGSGNGTIPILGMKYRGDFSPGIFLMAENIDASTFNIKYQIAGGDSRTITVNPSPLQKNQEIKINYKIDFINRTWSFSTNGSGYKGGPLPEGINIASLKAGLISNDLLLGWYSNYEDELWVNSGNVSNLGTMIVDGFKLHAPARGADINVLRTALQQMTGHILGTNSPVLTQAQQDNFTNEIIANHSGNYTNVKTDIDAYLAAFSANNVPLFSNRAATYTLASFNNIERITYYLQQDIFDREFVSGKMATMAGTKFREGDIFPGPVSATAPRATNAQVNINATQIQDPGIFLVDLQHGVYRPTGYYAAPGELITVTVPPALVNQNVEVMIGAHIREAWDQRLKRFQRISKKVTITNTTIQIANPFGGAVFFKIPRGASLGWQNVTINGAVKSPYFRMISGQPQNINEWITDLNNNYVPWADIESDRMMFTLPTSMVDKSDITKQMQKWNEGMALVNYVAGRPASPVIRSEYVQVDCTFSQNTAGYPKRMHSDAYNGLAYNTSWNPLRILEENYASSDANLVTMLHELGHNIFMPKSHGGYAEVFVQLTTVPFFYNLINDFDQSIKFSEHERFDRDLTAIHWMIMNEFRTNQNMTKEQRVYQSRGAGWYFDIFTLYNWEGLHNMHDFFYDKRATEGTTDSSYHYGLTIPITEFYQATAERIGENLLPLYHFWGAIPGNTNINAYTSMTVAESCEVYNRLLYYKSLVPTSQAEFTPWRDALFANGLWNAFGDQAIVNDIHTNYDSQNIGTQIIAQIDNILNIYYPNGSPCANFKTTWTVTAGNTSITIPTDSGSTYSYQVDWNGDGDFLDTNETTPYTGNATHDFGASGTYSINIKGTFPRILFNNTGDKDKIVSIDQWGGIQWQSMENAFYGCTNLTVSDKAGIPNLSTTTNLSSMFRASGITTTGNLNDWDVNNISNLNNMFRDATSFNQSLGKWDISSVTSMNDMFNGVTIYTTNYDDTLIGWATQDEKETQIPSNIIFHGGNSKYCLSDSQRTQLMTATDSGGRGWTITDSNILECQIKISPVAFLQGATLNPIAGENYLMRDNLRAGGLIPTTSPYNDALTCDPSVFNVTGANAIVDWVWLELRDATNTSSIVASRSALLQRDGDIVGVNGASPVTFNVSTLNTYTLVVNHRNHHAVMTNPSNPISFSNATYFVDFTKSSQPTFGTNALTNFGMSSNIGLWSGNVINDNSIRFSGTNNDTNQIKSTIINATGNILGLPTFAYNGYHNEDVNMDGIARFSSTNNDSNVIKSNVLNNPSNILNLLTFPILEQLP